MTDNDTVAICPFNFSKLNRLACRCYKSINFFKCSGIKKKVNSFVGSQFTFGVLFFGIF